MSSAHSFSAALGVTVPPISIVDVGAMSEGPERYARLVEGGMASVVGFEPNPDEFAPLAAAAGTRRRYLPYCLGKGGPAMLHITSYPGCISLYRPNPAVIELFMAMGTSEPDANFHVLRTESVITHRLDDVVECPRPDYLKLDVQGAELDVLEGSQRALADCLVVESEVEFVPLYERQPLFADVEQFLRARGFVLHRLVDVAGRAMRPFILRGSPAAPLSQLLWADAIFIRDFTRLEVLSDDQLLKMACILHEAYRSIDMAYHYLREYDRRGGTRTSDLYAPLAQAHAAEVTFMSIREG
jgi:FkbM family methyltransferase